MLIAQITDLHLSSPRGDPQQPNEARLDAVLARLRAMRPAPDLMLVTGDLTEGGEAAGYAHLAERLAALPWPSLVTAGNHDRRAPLAAAFPDALGPNGLIQGVHDAGGLRFLLLDSVEEGRHGGAFDADRAAWLSARLDESGKRPVVIVLHHPPIPTGIDWMTIGAAEPWAIRLERAIAGRGNVVAILAGHVHRPIVTHFAGAALIVCPSCAPAVALELAPLDPDRPDDRPMVLADPPAYALHWWTGERLVTHFDTAGPHRPIARFDAEMQPTVAKLMGEGAGA